MQSSVVGIRRRDDVESLRPRQMFAIARRASLLLALVEGAAGGSHEDVLVLVVLPLPAFVRPRQLLQAQQLVAVVHLFRAGGRVRVREARCHKTLVDAEPLGGAGRRGRSFPSSRVVAAAAERHPDERQDPFVMVPVLLVVDSPRLLKRQPDVLLVAEFFRVLLRLQREALLLPQLGRVDPEQAHAVPVLQRERVPVVDVAAVGAEVGRGQRRIHGRQLRLQDDAVVTIVVRCGCCRLL